VTNARENVRGNCPGRNVGGNIQREMSRGKCPGEMSRENVLWEVIESSGTIE